MRAAAILALVLLAEATALGLRLQAEPVGGFDLGCYDEDDKGKAYKGLQTQTASGRTCQNWTKQKPHEQNIDPSTTNGLGNHNYCRNPDGSKEKPWCYTMDPSPDHARRSATSPSAQAWRGTSRTRQG